MATWLCGCWVTVVSTVTALARSASSIEATPGASTGAIAAGNSASPPTGSPGIAAARVVRAGTVSYSAETSAAASRACSMVSATTSPMT
jgi:hypothetical protein